MSFLTALNPSTLYLNIAKVIGVVLIIITVLVGDYYVGYINGGSDCKLSVMGSTIDQLEDHAKSLASQQITFNESIEALNKTLSDHSQTTKIINTKTEREIEKPVYRNIIVPSSGMQLIADNATILNAKRVSRSPISEVSGTPNAN